MSHEIIRQAIDNFPYWISLLPIALKVTIKLTGITARRKDDSLAIVKAGEKEVIVRSGANNVQTTLADEAILIINDYPPGHGTLGAKGNAVVYVERNGERKRYNLNRHNDPRVIEPGITATYTPPPAPTGKN